MPKLNIFKQGPYPTLVGVVTTCYKDIVNAAPITWFSPISYDPPLMMISIKEKSDTTKNIIDTGNFTLQTVPYEIAQQVHNMAAPYRRNVSEIEKVGLSYHKVVVTTDYGDVIAGPIAPYLSDAIDWFSCRLINVYTNGDHYQFIGEVMAYRTGGLSSQKLALLSHGGTEYTYPSRIIAVDKY